MRCSSVQRRLTSEARRLSTHFAFFPRSWRRSLACGRLSPRSRSALFSGSSLMDFTGCCLPTRLGVRVLGSGGVCELRMGSVRPLFRHRSTVPADSKLFGSSLCARFFTAGLRLVFPEMRQFAFWLLTDEGMVTA